MPIAAPGQLAAVILAGGQGSRLGGVNKANLTIGGVRLIDRVAAVLRGATPLIVAVGRHAAQEFALPLGAIAVPDAEPMTGPLAGLAAAVEWCAASAAPPATLLSVAVDSPVLPQDYVARLVGALTASDDGAIAAYAGQPYPTNAAWRLDSLRPLLVPETQQGLSQAGIKGFALGLRTRVVEWPESAAGDPFANLNTPLDREPLERRAAAEAVADPAQNAAQNGVGKLSQSR